MLKGARYHLIDFSDLSGHSTCEIPEETGPTNDGSMVAALYCSPYWLPVVSSLYYGKDKPGFSSLALGDEAAKQHLEVPYLTGKSRVRRTTPTWYAHASSNKTVTFPHIRILIDGVLDIVF